MNLTAIKPNAPGLSDVDLINIQKITNDVAALKHFIDQLNGIKDQKLKALYIVTEKNYQIEFKTGFSLEFSETLYKLILESRQAMVNKLETVLTSYLSDKKTTPTNAL